MSDTNRNQNKEEPVHHTAMLIYALLFTASKPIDIESISTKFNIPDTIFTQALASLKQILEMDSPFYISEADNKAALMTKPEYGDAIRHFHGIKKTRLSEASLEVLSYIAYNQPVFKKDLDELRGLDNEAVLDTLRRYGLVTAIGSLNTPGTPIAYSTTEKFLLMFGLKNLNELPPIN